MNSRERILKTINHKEPDRVPIDIGGSLATTIHRIIYDKLKREFGMKAGKEEILEFALQSVVLNDKVLKKLHGDVIGIYSKPPKSWKMKIDLEDNSYIDEWGIKYRATKSGLYFDIIDYAIKEVTMDKLDRFNWPDPHEEGRFEGLEEKAKHYYENTDYALSVGCTFGGGILQDGAWLVGFENWFSLLALDKNLAGKVMDKLLKFHIGYWDAMLSRIGKYVQVVVIADDLGTQDNLFISPKVFRELIKPRYIKLIDFIKSKANVKVFLHSDGAIRELIPDLIEVGIDILNPIQVSARGMGDTKALKEEFGEKLVFWGGGCDTQKILPFGKPDNIKREVEKRISDLKPGGGFVFAPVHNIQPEVPVQNVLTLYETALQFGYY
ncbi:MAG: uroporphyrinogen-III decarboxylase [Actinobacteria bacterium]|nr:uroporphyrinogen-III decarboxylase [Actinomycetota bacterium]